MIHNVFCAEIQTVDKYRKNTSCLMGVSLCFRQVCPPTKPRSSTTWWSCCRRMCGITFTAGTHSRQATCETAWRLWPDPQLLYSVLTVAVWFTLSSWFLSVWVTVGRSPQVRRGTSCQPPVRLPHVPDWDWETGETPQVWAGHVCQGKPPHRMLTS